PVHGRCVLVGDPRWLTGVSSRFVSGRPATTALVVAGSIDVLSRQHRVIAARIRSLVSALAAALSTQPSVRFRHRRWFYVLYDGTYLVLSSLALALMLSFGWPGLVREFHWWYWLLLPLVCHAQILCSVFIHNCSHGNFPKPINRLVGELCGIVVLTRYASWEI